MGQDIISLHISRHTTKSFFRFRVKTPRELWPKINVSITHISSCFWNFCRSHKLRGRENAPWFNSFQCIQERNRESRHGAELKSRREKYKMRDTVLPCQFTRVESSWYRVSSILSTGCYDWSFLPSNFFPTSFQRFFVGSHLVIFMWICHRKSSNSEMTIDTLSDPAKSV